MAKHNFTQIGTFSLAIMVPLFLLSLIMLFIPGFRDSGGVPVMGLVVLTLFVCLLIFYKLTITVDETSLTFSLGVGLITKRYLLDEIKSCKAVTNSPLTGIGIRMISNGWLYNVSGLGAIELAFKNKSSVVRIGTNNPELVSQTINAYIKQDIHGSETYEKKSAGIFSSIAVFVIVMIVVGILLFTGNKEISVKTDDKDFTITGMYGLTFKYADLISIDTVSDLPGIRLRTNGYAFGNTLKGNFMLEDKSRVKLFITKGTSPYLHLKTGNVEIYLNFRDHNKTRDLYKQLKTFVISL